MSKCRLLVTIPLMIAFQTPKSKAILLTATICWLEATIMPLLLSVVEIKTQSKITVIEQHFGSFFENTPLEGAMMQSNRPAFAAS